MLFRALAVSNNRIYENKMRKYQNK